MKTSRGLHEDPGSFKDTADFFERTVRAALVCNSCLGAGLGAARTSIASFVVLLPSSDAPGKFIARLLLTIPFQKRASRPGGLHSFQRLLDIDVRYR